MIPVLRRWYLLVVLSGLATAALAASPNRPGGLEAQGDRAWERRAEGFTSNRVVDLEPVNEAIEAWEIALLSDPNNIRLRIKLMEAIYFQGFFALSPGQEQTQRFDRLLALAEETVERFDALRRPAGVTQVAEFSPGAPISDVAEPLPGTIASSGADPEGAAVHLWMAGAWGLWGVSHGNLASARRGVAEKMRDEALLAAQLDETYSDGGPWRLLGRLNTVTPRVPLFTGWIRRDEGIEQLERALALSRADGRNLLFLAEALLEYDSSRRCEAIDLLHEVLDRNLDPLRVVEEAHVADQARRTLASEPQAGCREESVGDR